MGKWLLSAWKHLLVCDPFPKVKLPRENFHDTSKRIKEAISTLSSCVIVSRTNCDKDLRQESSADPRKFPE